MKIKTTSEMLSYKQARNKIDTNNVPTCISILIFAAAAEPQGKNSIYRSDKLLFMINNNY